MLLGLSVASPGASKPGLRWAESLGPSAEVRVPLLMTEASRIKVRRIIVELRGRLVKGALGSL